MMLLSRLFHRSQAEAIAWLDPDQLSALLNGLEPLAIIDVRSPNEFDGPLGHIPSARNIPLDRIGDHAKDLLAADKRLVMVCHTDRRSSAAARMIQPGAAAAVYVLRGGMVAWVSRGH